MTKALADADLKYGDIEQAVVGYCYGERHSLVLTMHTGVSNN